MADKKLDARHLKCPFPILKAKRAIDQIEIGQTLEVLATDPGSKEDFEAFADSTGNILLEQTYDSEGIFRFLIQRQY